MGPIDPVYREILVRKIVGVVRQAAETLRPARLAYGTAPCQIGVNRRPTYPEGRTIRGFAYAGPVAPSVQALSVTDPGGAPFALLMLHACHPVTLGGDNLLITADWCGYACRVVQEATGGAVMPFLLQGCCANINPFRSRTFAAAEENGRDVGRAALIALEQAEPLPDDAGLAFSETVLSLPQLLPDAGFETEAIAGYEAELARAREENASKGQLLFLEGRLDCARDRLAVALQTKPDLSQSFAVQHLSVGGADFLGLPGEMFVQYQNDFSAQCPRPVFTAAFSNGCHGYVPTAADYAYGGYEVRDAFHYYGTLMITEDCERLIREEVYRLLQIENPDGKPYTVHRADL
jgi:neutral ceramidase